MLSFGREVKTTAVSLVNLKKQMTTEEVEALRYIRLQSTESKFTVLGACPSAYVYEVSRKSSQSMLVFTMICNQM